MAEQGEQVMPLIPEGELSEFAKTLFRRLYYEVGMQHRAPKSSQRYRDSIGEIVICVRNATRDFNVKILNDCGFGVDKTTLCQEVCNLYPDQKYFKKLFYVTGFILDMMYEWYEASDAVDYSQGPRIWKKIFRVNFEMEFRKQGGWDALYAAAEAWQEILLDVLPSENLLPAMIAGVVARVRQFNPVPQPAIPDEAEAALERLRAGKMEIDDSSDESMQSEGGFEKKQPGKVALVEGSEEVMPEVMDVGPCSSGIGDNVAQTGHLGESSSSRSAEDDVPRSVGDRTSRKRRHPLETDPNKERSPLSPSRSKMDKRSSVV